MIKNSTVEIHKLEYQIPASVIFEYVTQLPCPVWLDSGYPAANHGRFDIISASPECTLAAETTSVIEVQNFLSNAQSQLERLGQPTPSTSIPFQGGLIGYLGYDLDRELCELPQRTAESEQTHIADQVPKGYLGLYLWAFIYDHHSQSSQVIFHPHCDAALKARVLGFVEELQSSEFSKSSIASSNQYGQNEPPFQLETQFEASETETHYFSNISRIKEYIRAGDVYQVNYAQHFSARYRGSSSAAYLSQRLKHPAPYSAYIGLDTNLGVGLDANAIMSHSPEEFIHIQGGEVQTQPIKGTAPRATNPQLDTRNAEVLQSSTKDRAENLMIVDLLRNDLGQFCEPGSISVPKLFELQSFSNVHHLVSQIRGRLVRGSKNLDVLMQCHPSGSITGAPKRRAMQIIDELESIPRGVYCGNIGFFSCCGQSTTNVAIRTLVADGNKIHCWGGGGIVADSNAEREYQETLFKVGPMMKSLEEEYLQEEKQKKEAL